MLKKIDAYVLKTFISPFIAIFGILFFLFLLSFVWQKLGDFIGRGAGFIVIAKAIFYLGVSIIRMVLPLTILLTTIMTFGGLGERYELAAIKSTGTSLWRVMRSLFVFSIVCAFVSFFFSNTIATNAFQRAQNLRNNILQSQAALAIEPGVFNEINGFPIHVRDKKGDSLIGVYMYQRKSLNDDQNTIIAQRGIIRNHDSLPFITITLYDGFVYQDLIRGQRNLMKQSANKIKFDTLIQRFDVTKLLSQNVDDETGPTGTHYKSMPLIELQAATDTLEKLYKRSQDNFIRQSSTQLFIRELDKFEVTTSIESQEKELLSFSDSSFSKEDQIRAAESALNDFTDLKDNTLHFYHESSTREKKLINRYTLEAYNRFIYALECIVMFLIAAPLGAIIRKGGLGMPLVVGIVIFIVFFLLEALGNYTARNGLLPAAISAVIPIIVLFPISVYLCIKANRDSTLFDIDHYFEPFRRFYRRLRPEKIHTRYQ